MINPSHSQPSFLYVVRCTFEPGTADVAQRWLSWLRDIHLSEVLAAGAISADVIQISNDRERYEVHYRFASEEDFLRYERDHAPSLRADGLSRFPLSLGLAYERSVGTILFSSGCE